MAYAVYLVDDLTTSTSYTELDIEGVDFGTTFNVSDIQDINSRKDNITKQLLFKGTQDNNNAFGTLFHLNRSTDIDTMQNKLFFNYNPLRTVDCLIYEDNVLILRGTMRVHKISVKDGVPYYHTVVTGAIIDLKEALADKYLHDLDLTDLQHRWNVTNIMASRDSTIEKYDATTSTYSNQAFSKGTGYVYPFIDYGHSFQKPEYNANRHTTHVHMSNMRPAVYAKEYFDRIFAQMPGYTYEIKGSTEDVQKFNSLIIPNNEELMVEKNTLKNFKKTNGNSMATGDNSANGYPANTYQFVSANGVNHMFMGVPLSSGTSTLITPYSQFRGQNNTVFSVDRDFKTDGLVTLKLTGLQQNNPYYSGMPMKLYVQLVERDFVSSAAGGSYHNHEGWTNVASMSFNLPYGATINKDVQLEVGEYEFKKGKQLMMRLILESPAGWFPWLFGGTRPVNFTINSGDAKVYLPKNNTSGLITFNIHPGDEITPKAPKDIKQMDFIKSVISVFNYYVYTERERPKHLIFQSYNDFYSLTSPDVLKEVARDWTDKVDYKNGIEIESNLKLPKKYLFTFKDDTSDFFNKDYKTNFGAVYGQFSFNDAFGLTEQKKLELIFSPSPTVEYPGTGRLHPGYWIYDSGKPKPVKTNIRLLFYNGVKNCNSFLLATDKFNTTTSQWEIETQGGSNTTYALASEYYFRDGIGNMYPVDVLQFGQPQLTYFAMSNVYTRADMLNIYFNRYMQQVTDLTDPNVVFVECDAYLNEIDIANLDLKIPVFIDMGELGHAYFKVLSVEYDSKDVSAKVKLQKITL